MKIVINYRCKKKKDRTASSQTENVTAIIVKMRGKDGTHSENTGNSIFIFPVSKAQKIAINSFCRRIRIIESLTMTEARKV